MRKDKLNMSNYCIDHGIDVEDFIQKNREYDLAMLKKGIAGDLTVGKEFEEIKRQFIDILKGKKDEEIKLPN